MNAKAVLPFAAAALLALVAGASAAWCLGGEPPPAPVAPTQTDMFQALLPDLRQAAAPPWLKPGLRLTFYVASATINGSRHYHVRDDTGDWVDADGNRWAGYDSPRSSAHGYTQVNVVALDAQAAVLDVRLYGFVNLTEGPLLQTSSSCIVPPGSGAEYWLSPAVLQRVQDQRTPNVVILRMPYTVRGQTFQAIRFQSQDATARHAYVYDLATGVLLHANSSVLTRGNTAPANAPAGTTLMGDQTLLAQTTLMGVRQLQVPWAAAEPPAWLRTATAFQYAGQTVISIPYCPPFPMPISIAMQVRNRGANWLQLDIATQSQVAAGFPAQTNRGDRAAGLAQFGGLWIPPAAAGLLRAGQVLDQDPYTKVTVSVIQAGPTPDGRRIVQIAEVGQGQRLECVYDAATGLLTAGTETNDSLHMRTQYQLTGSR